MSAKTLFEDEGGEGPDTSPLRSTGTGGLSRSTSGWTSTRAGASASTSSRRSRVRCCKLRILVNPITDAGQPSRCDHAPDGGAAAVVNVGHCRHVRVRDGQAPPRSSAGRASRSARCRSRASPARHRVMPSASSGWALLGLPSRVASRRCGRGPLARLEVRTSVADTVAGARASARDGAQLYSPVQCGKANGFYFWLCVHRTAYGPVAPQHRSAAADPIPHRRTNRNANPQSLPFREPDHERSPRIPKKSIAAEILAVKKWDVSACASTHFSKQTVHTFQQTGTHLKKCASHSCCYKSGKEPLNVP